MLFQCHSFNGKLYLLYMANNYPNIFEYFYEQHVIIPVADKYISGSDTFISTLFQMGIHYNADYDA